MKKAVSLILALAFLGALLSSQDAVDKAELTPVKGDLAFISYEGPRKSSDSAAVVKAIGEGPGLVVSASLAKATTAGDPGRYYVIHAIGPEAGDGLRNADIVVLGASVRVDHIRNLRLIIQGYLEKAYGYSEADAATLAKYITIYNAVYRGQLDYFKGKYKSAVMSYLDAAKAGLALDWKDWAGKSQILIPLTPKAAEKGHISSVDTGPITDKTVKDTLAKEPGKGIDEGKGMVAIKEKEAVVATAEAAKATDKAAADKAAADKAAADAAAAKVAADKAKADAAGAKTAADKAAEAAKPVDTGSGTPALVEPGKTAAAETAKAAADKAATDAAAADKTAADKAATAEAAKATADASAADAAKAAAAAKAKEDEALKEREAVAAAQKAKLAEEAAAAEAAKAGTTGVGLMVISDSYPFFARIVSYDAAKGTTLKTSAIDTIRARTLIAAGGDYVAIAGKKEGSGAIRLVIIGGKSLEMTSQGDDDIYADSALVAAGGFYYAVVETPEGLFLGKFDKALKRVARSDKPVKGATSIAVTDKGVLVQGSSGGFLLLGAGDLKTSLEVK